MKRVMVNAGWFMTVAVIAVVLWNIPGRDRIPPHFGSDYNYIYAAADRMYEGLGYTSTIPKAPFQPWEWRADWSFLTQWPVGYAALLCAFRWLFGCTSLEAGQWIAAICCAGALVGWFRWGRCVLGRGVVQTLLAIVAAFSCLSTELLINPMTDTIAVAVLPWVLLAASCLTGNGRKSGSASTGFADEGGDDGQARGETLGKEAGSIAFLLLGVVAGSVCWVRYAAVFIPVSVGLFFVWATVKHRVGLRGVFLYAVGSLVPLAVLFVFNHINASGTPVQQQFNLGSRLGLAIDPSVLATVWWMFTDLPMYGHKWYAHWVCAIVVPLGGIAFACVRSDWRRSTREYVRSEGYVLSALAVVTMLGVLVAVSLLCRSKHTFVDISRYYLPARPLYFLLFVGPVLAVSSRVVRGLSCIPLVLSGMWYVQQEWPRPFDRWLSAGRVVTGYGRWSKYFEPGSTELYEWLRGERSEQLAVFSNFPDEIMLETGIPASPTPDDVQQLEEWLGRMRAARGIREMRVLFVLDSSNHTREYFLRSPMELVKTFGLRSCDSAPDSVSGYVFECSGLEMETGGEEGS